MSRDPVGVDAGAADAAWVGVAVESAVRDAALPRCYGWGEREHKAEGFEEYAVAEDELEGDGAVAVKAAGDVECRAISVAVVARLGGPGRGAQG